MEFDWQPVWLTLKLATTTTVILLFAGTPLAWWLSRKKSLLKQSIATVIALPLVLPPTVIGFYLLLLLGPEGPIGILTTGLGIESLAFTFTGLVIASVLYSMPFAIQPLQNAFEALGQRPLEVAATLRAAPLDSFFHVTLPLCRSGFLSAGILTFAHTMGEFGVILMIGGNIPGETRVLSVAIYDHVEALEYGQAHLLAGGMLGLSFVILLSLYFINDRLDRKNRS